MTIEELEAQLETVTRERDEARAYAEDRNDEANKLQRCLNMAATERDEAREQAKAYNDNAYALSLGVDQLTKERDEARAEVERLRVALEQSEVEVSLARTWCRVCRTECRSTERSREKHPHEARCILARRRENL